MKKVVLSLLAALLIFAAISVSVPASAASFSDLGSLQDALMKYSPDQLIASGPQVVNLEGTISEIHWCGTGNHYEFTLLVDDPKAMIPLGAESPQLSVHFRLHKDTPPFQVGDEVEVYGSLNVMYSSVMVPQILLEYINGSDDF